MNGFSIQQQQDLAKHEDQGTDVHILGVDEQPMFYRDKSGTHPVTITVAGVHSQRYRAAEEKLRRRRLKPHQLTGNFVQEDNLTKVVACTLGWRGIVTDNETGTELEFTEHNVRMLYTACPWVMDQVMEAMQDPSRFFARELKPLAPTSDSTQD